MTTVAGWKSIAPKLREHGIDTSKIRPLQQSVVVAETLRMGASLEWASFAAGLADEHPTWETPAARRRRHLDELLEEDHFELEAGRDVDEVAKAKYAIVVQNSGSRWLDCADDDHGIAQTHIGTYMHDGDDVEWIDRVVDLDTGEPYTYDSNVVVIATVNGTEARSDA